METWRFVQYAKVVCLSAIIAFCLMVPAGCGPKISSPQQVRDFERAGPVTSPADIDGLTKQKTHLGPYRVVPGDILEFQLPVALRVISSDLTEWLRPAYGHKDVEAYLARVNEQGHITLPIVEKLFVSGKTLAEIESLVIDAYYPKYVVNSPMVVCQIDKYRTENERVFTVMGLVGHPDAFPYPPDVQYSLMEALAFAGGLDMVADPRYLKIYRQNEEGEILSATFGVDKKSLADASRVIIKPGDIIYVDHTLRTRTNQFFADVFQFRVGASVTRSSSD
ncbi:MAG: polysaccharide biosynthesis/export family protein [Planctomycetes bacterium]|nr:polysaccharide biosynthesis/export family protein [Planctomycetota bacterium]